MAEYGSEALIQDIALSLCFRCTLHFCRSSRVSLSCPKNPTLSYLRDNQLTINGMVKRLDRRQFDANEQTHADEDVTIAFTLFCYCIVSNQFQCASDPGPCCSSLVLRTRIKNWKPGNMQASETTVVDIRIFNREQTIRDTSSQVEASR